MSTDAATFLGHAGKAVKPAETAKSIKVAKKANVFFVGHLHRQGDHHFFWNSSSAVQGRPAPGCPFKSAKGAKFF